MENDDMVLDCMEDQNILIDRLEDEIIDHPSASAGTSQYSDESFQHKLNERANQIQQGSEWSSSDPNGPYPDHNSHSASYQFLHTNPNLVYECTDHGGLRQELDQWFVTTDFVLIGLDKLKGRPVLEIDLENVLQISSLDLRQRSECLDLLVYYILGTYGATSEQDQLRNISENCNSLMALELFHAVLRTLRRALDQCMAMSDGSCDKSFTREFTSNYFKLLTIVYFSVNVALTTSNITENVLLALTECDLLTRIVKLSEKWKINPHSHLRLRNCLLLHWKLLLVEFGNSEHLAHVDEYLTHKYEVKNKDRKEKNSHRLTCSPVDYYTFEEDVQDKYPMMRSRKIDSFVRNSLWNENGNSERLPSLLLHMLSLLQEKEIFMAANLYSNSQSNLIAIPRTNKQHSVYGCLPGQAVHIATPVPSPPSTPSEFMSGGEKVRKLYHVNQGLPFMYPFEDHHNVPEAISEASGLIEKGVYESYLAKRLSHERANFLEKERGNGIGPYVELEASKKNDHEDNDNDPTLINAVRSLDRVEVFYKRTLEHLRAFVDVLVGIIKTSKVEVSLRDLETELDPESSFNARFGPEDHTQNKKILAMVYHQLDVLRAKEITLKAISAILVLTLRWFKRSHPLKAYYFSSLLFDARYQNVFVEFLADSFNNPALQNLSSENKGMLTYDILSSQNRLMNPPFSFAQLSFFTFCHEQPTYCTQNITLVNKVPLDKLPQTVDDANQTTISITEFNHDFCFILVNLLNVTNKVLIKHILQRVFVFNESKPTDLLKIILLNYVNEALRQPLLKIFKKITPYQGRKWRALNMDVVSLIFLHMKLSLRDNWLSGKDLENEFRDSLEQEISLRSLLQFYNVRRYPHEMSALGYASSTCLPKVYCKQLD